MILNNIKARQKDGGFTIVELLVVIVVIGILAAITIVSYSGITARATTQSNKSNASSIASAAMVVYANTGAYPVPTATSSTNYTALNASDAKMPTGLLINNGVGPTTGANTTLIFHENAGLTGECIGYWDLSAPGPAWIFIGTAVSDNLTTCT
jgi:prepilin-type N-terminal cleavage/methylation domain-containing protein